MSEMMMDFLFILGFVFAFTGALALFDSMPKRKWGSNRKWFQRR